METERRIVVLTYDIATEQFRNKRFDRETARTDYVLTRKQFIQICSEPELGMISTNNSFVIFITRFLLSLAWGVHPKTVKWSP